MVFVVNASGGVGTLAIQLAKVVNKASRIVVTASASKADFLKSLGADQVIDYRTEDYTQLEEKFDFIFDLVGEAEKAVKLVKEGGHFAAIAGPDPPIGVRYIVSSVNRIANHNIFVVMKSY